MTSAMYFAAVSSGNWRARSYIRVAIARSSSVALMVSPRRVVRLDC